MTRDQYIERCAELRAFVAILADELAADAALPSFVAARAPTLLERIERDILAVENLAETRH